MGVFLAVLVCGRLWAWHISLVSVCQKPMFGSEGCMLNRENTPVVIWAAFILSGIVGLGQLYGFQLRNVCISIWVYISFLFSWPLPEPYLTPSFRPWSVTFWLVCVWSLHMPFNLVVIWPTLISSIQIKEDRNSFLMEASIFVLRLDCQPPTCSQAGRPDYKLAMQPK